MINFVNKWNMGCRGNLIICDYFYYHFNLTNLLIKNWLLIKCTLPALSDINVSFKSNFPVILGRKLREARLLKEVLGPPTYQKNWKRINNQSIWKCSIKCLRVLMNEQLIMNGLDREVPNKDMKIAWRVQKHLSSDHWNIEIC